MDEPPRQPPADPEEWTSEEWIAWLEETDPARHGDGPPVAGPVTAGGRLARSGPGAVLGNAMTGMSQAIYGERDEPALVEEAPSNPEDEDLELHLDPDHPERSVAIVRRRFPDHRLEEREPGGADGEAEPADHGDEPRDHE